MYWLQAAERHYFSSQILYDRLNELIIKHKEWTDDENISFLALMDSFFLLFGLAMENLLKGIIISKRPIFKQKKDLVNLYGFNYRHDIMLMLKKNFRSLNKNENELIARLQDYIKWMGKYPIPNENDLQKDFSHTLQIKDNAELIIIYQELKLELIKKYSQTEKLYLEYFDKRNM